MCLCVCALEVADALLVVLVYLFVDLYALPRLADHLLQQCLFLHEPLELSFPCCQFYHPFSSLLYEVLLLLDEALLDLVLQLVYLFHLF